MDYYWVPIDNFAHTIASKSLLRVAPTKKKTNRTVVPMWWLTIECLSTMDETIEVLHIRSHQRPYYVPMWWITIDCLSTMDETIEVQTVWRIIYWSNYTGKKCFAIIIIINWFIFIFSSLYWTPAHILVYLVHSIHLYYWRPQILVRSIRRVAQCDVVVFIFYFLSCG